MIKFKNLAFSCGLAIGAIALSCQPAGATTIVGAATGIASADVTIDFEAGALANNTVVTNQFAGVTFGTNFQILSPGVAPNIVGRFLSDISDMPNGGIFFDTNVTAASFSFRTNPGTTTFEAFLDGVSQEVITSAVTNLTTPNNFFGFQNILFDEIRFTVSASTQGFNLDNLEFVTVPEPSAIALLGLGLIGLGAMRRRRAA